MKTNLQSLFKVLTSTLLLGTAILFTSCSKEQEIAPNGDLVAKIHEDNSFDYVNGPVISGQGYDYPTVILYDRGNPFYSVVSSHPEIADRCSIEFSQGGNLALVARHVNIGYDFYGNNDGRGVLSYNIPFQLAPGTYTITLRTESANRSLVIATTGDPSTYVHSVSDNITFTRATSPTSGFYPDGLYDTGQPWGGFYTDLPLAWKKANFGTGYPYNTRLRAFALNQSTGTLYQLTPVYNNISPQFAFFLNDEVGSTSAPQNSTSALLNENGEPRFIPFGIYSPFIDNFATKYAGGPYSFEVGILQ